MAETANRAVEVVHTPMVKQDRMRYTVSQLAAELGLEFVGDAKHVIESVASLKSAQRSDLCFLQSGKFRHQLKDSHCGAIIVRPTLRADLDKPAVLYSDNPYLSFVRAIQLFGLDQSVSPGPSRIDPSARIAPGAQLGSHVSVGANSVIGAGVVIAEHASIGAGCVIEDQVCIGEHSRLLANVTVCHDVVIGREVILHPGVVIGSDGFGLVQDQSTWVKVPHLGTVVIGDRVEIGANTTVDRGALDDTIIENGVKLDNLIQVGHNVHIGENTAIAACVGIAGSAVIGKNCRISGAAVVLGHLSVADNVTVTAMSLVTKSIKHSGVYSSGTPLMENHDWHRNNVRYKSLDQLARTVAKLEKKQE